MDSKDNRKRIISLNTLPKLIELSSRDIKIDFLTNILWAISEIIKEKPPQATKILKIMPSFFQTNDEHVIQEALKILNTLSNGSPKQINKVIKTGLLPRVLELIYHSINDIKYSALKILGNVASGDDDHTQYVIDLGMLEKIEKLFQSYVKKPMKKEII